MNSLYLENITVVNYKNIVNMVYDLDKNINCFVKANSSLLIDIQVSVHLSI